ncbi:hypothetical protein RND81_10G070400 [Saponaria officinalis]|uniref:Uncharacterized protein n=1 Tax=Saponaria officinalis TaxID=3572 RepID=A0AAW1I0A0_SAPOF
MEPDTWNTAASAAADQGDSSSTEEVESPRSVVTAAARRGSGRWRLWRRSGDRNKEKEKACLHSQVMRIKEEEMQISEDLIGDHYSSYDYVADCHSLDDVWCRNNLPASPLGCKRN